MNSQYPISRGPKSGSSKTTSLRRKLRHDMTPAEKLFWSKVGGKQFYNLKFRRQHSIGNYIVDFYCPERKLIVEIDGDTHTDQKIMNNDEVRTNYLRSLGYEIIRYTNRDVLKNTEGVVQDLNQRLTPSNSPSRGGEPTV